ncbi:phosphate ABC transporter permease PtsA [Aphanothece hegewaldii CCALA 016]|uniref:Phosphate transport system permease protein PstA n=1 Tax=Aphanothece hegewaldii CCALA 016 TaxID=2107694 RepID=A0A2T1LSD3_9CHRO|nr:phosphate ABC transporter permease PstA [Aphanothece hegewaldii]PSF32655.1 phosphate ABC transporter permease PtsA [Aphanothece hegewaldii CCALA 016]
MSTLDFEEVTNPNLNLKRETSSPRSLFGLIMTGLSAVCLTITTIPLFLLIGYVIYKGGSRLGLDLFTELPPPPGLEGGGFANAILGTIIVVSIATAIAVPIGVLAAVYLSEFSGGGKTAQWVRFATNVLSGVPSIIAGIFAFGLFVAPLIGNRGIFGFSAIAAAIGLAVLMLPTIIRTTDEALQIVPQDIRWAALGIGAYNYQTVLKVVLPAAIPAIITGVTLAVARAAGETASLIFTALFSNFWPRGIFEPIATLSVLVFNFATVPFQPQQELAWAGSLILVLLVLIASIAARLATRQR